MGTARKLTSGRWQARARLDADRYTSVGSFRTRAEALAAARDAEAQARAGTYVSPRGGEVLFREWAIAWAASQGGESATRAQRESLVRSHLLPAFGDLPLRAIRPLAVRGFVADLERLGYARATIAATVKLLGRVMRAAVDEGLLASSPVPARIAGAGQRSTEKTFLTLEQVGRLADTVPPRYRALVLLAAVGSGMRWGELAGLRMPRLDLGEGKVHVAAVVEEVGPLRLREYPKTSKSRRTITLPAGVVAELLEHVARFPPAGPEQLVFTAPRGGMLSRVNFRRSVLRPAVAAAGLPERVTFHSLRHTHAALCIAEGFPPKALQVRLGHESITTTLDTYGHLYDDADAGIAEGLDRLFRATFVPPTS